MDPGGGSAIGAPGRRWHRRWRREAMSRRGGRAAGGGGDDPGGGSRHPGRRRRGAVAPASARPGIGGGNDPGRGIDPGVGAAGRVGGDRIGGGAPGGAPPLVLAPRVPVGRQARRPRRRGAPGPGGPLRCHPGPMRPRRGGAGRVTGTVGRLLRQSWPPISEMPRFTGSRIGRRGRLWRRPPPGRSRQAGRPGPRTRRRHRHPSGTPPGRAPPARRPSTIHADCPPGLRSPTCPYWSSSRVGLAGLGRAALVALVGGHVVQAPAAVAHPPPGLGHGHSIPSGRAARTLEIVRSEADDR